MPLSLGFLFHIPFQGFSRQVRFYGPVSESHLDSGGKLLPSLLFSENATQLPIFLGRSIFQSLDFGHLDCFQHFPLFQKLVKKITALMTIFFPSLAPFSLYKCPKVKGYKNVQGSEMLVISDSVALSKGIRLNPILLVKYIPLLQMR